MSEAPDNRCPSELYADFTGMQAPMRCALPSGHAGEHQATIEGGTRVFVWHEDREAQA